MKKKNPNPILGKLSPVTNDLKQNDVDSLQKDFVNHVEYSLAKDKYSATQRDFYKSLCYTIRDRLFERWIETQQAYYRHDAKRIYYISMEYMMGRTLDNALINMDLETPLKNALWQLGIDMEELAQIEFDAGLGNGGLGRLAACFLDSMATLSLPGYGYGIRYEYGIFSQKIANGYQVESPDHWLRYGNPWEIERPEYIYFVKFYGHTNTINKDGRQVVEWVDTQNIIAMAYDTPIPGYKNNTVNNLRLWAAKSTRDFNLDFFNSGNYEGAVYEKISSETISKILYPRDDILPGRELRLRQEFFLVSATLQDIIRRYRKSYKTFKQFPQKVAIQLNDTHPSLAIPELMRILLDEEFLTWEEAWDITSRTFNYTNHTILPEALEKWRVALVEKVLPRHMQIIFEINHRFLNHISAKYPGDTERLRRTSVIEEANEKYVRMANLSIIGSASVNGVAALHSEIIKKNLFRDFYELWPKKFNNKTNGITQRRWLLLANPALAKLITETIGSGWQKDLFRLQKLKIHAAKKEFQEKWHAVKQQNKKTLADFIMDKTNIKVNINSIFDVQVKRIHEYKRQLLNILHILTLYNRIISNNAKNIQPRTFIFSGKAAPSYTNAKLIIKLINSIAEKINNDPQAGDLLKVVFLPDYSVSLAEKIIPAADLSEQTSTAGMEASGTGNMKFALNGALTIGTLDGANIEIKEQVGDDNIFIFGLTADEVVSLRNKGYNPMDYYKENEELKGVIDLINSGFFCAEEGPIFNPLIKDLLSKDYYMLFADYQAYIDTQDRISLVYKNAAAWHEMSVLNCSSMGMFSSDRTISEYNSEIWKSEPVIIKPGSAIS